MPSITTTDEYTFSNLGPVTTTFTAPASCSTAINNYGIGTSDLLPGFVYNVQCTRGGYNGCLPTATVPEIATLDLNPSAMYSQAYYSPGFYCPSGWATVGSAVGHGDKTMSASGVLDFPLNGP